LADANQLIIKVDLDKKQATSTFKSLEKQASKTGDTIGREVGQSFSKSFLANIGKLTALIGAAAGIRKVSQSFLGLETAIAEVNTIAGDLGKTNEELAKQFLDLSSQFGGTAAEQAKAFYQIISAGVTDAQAANNLLIASNKLAIGGLTSQAQAIDILTSSVNAFGQANLTGEQAADILFTTVKLGKTRVDELAASLGLILPTSKSLGVSFEETAGAIAQLTTKGLSTSLAVTQLNALFTAILKKQATAAELGSDVAEAFSLQAFRAKGLRKFLIDLNAALGGSEEKLIKLTGRAEAMRAVLSLAGDEFVGLGQKIDELRNASGAADEAFKRIQQTVEQQLNVAGANLLNIFTQLAVSTGDTLVNALTTLNMGLTFINKNLDSLIETFVRFGRVAIATGLILKRQLIIGFLTTKFLAFQKAVRITSIVLRATFFEAVLRGESRLKAFTLAAFRTKAGIDLLRKSLTLLKGVLTFGVLLAIDQIIVQFIELKDKASGMGQVFEILGQRIKLGFLTVLQDIVRFLFVEFGDALKKVGFDGAQAFVRLGTEILKTKETLRGFKDALPARPLAEFSEVLDTDLQAINEKTTLTFQTIGQSIAGFANIIIANTKLIFDNLTDTVKFSGAQLQSVAKIVGQGLAQGISKTVQAVVGALAKGENAFKALGASVLNVMGDLAISVGQFAVAVGIAKVSFEGLPGGATIAAGIGLIALGTLLKTLGGSSAFGTGDAGAGVGGGGGAAVPEPPTQDFVEPDEELERQTAVTVNVEGTVLDPVGVGQQIAEILDEAFNAGASTIAVNSA
jgi:TP901 family phage tail tape measure protein